MKNNLIINNKTNHTFLFKEEFQAILNFFATYFKIKKKIELSLIITDNKEITNLNLKYRGLKKPTDILSFPQDFEKLLDIIGFVLLGDIFMSYEKIEEQAKEYEHGLKRE
jgi:probable rRNA maturation factor